MVAGVCLLVSHLNEADTRQATEAMYGFLETASPDLEDKLGSYQLIRIAIRFVMKHDPQNYEARLKRIIEERTAAGKDVTFFQLNEPCSEGRQPTQKTLFQLES
jgi:hypothetical protein